MKAGLGVADRSAALETLRVQPAVGEGEVLAAVVVLAVVDAHDLISLADKDGFGAAVAHSGDQLGQVDGGIGGMVDAEKEHLTIQLVDAPHRTVQAVRDLDRVRR